MDCDLLLGDVPQRNQRKSMVALMNYFVSGAAAFGFFYRIVTGLRFLWKA